MNVHATKEVTRIIRVRLSIPPFPYHYTSRLATPWAARRVYQILGKSEITDASGTILVVVFSGTITSHYTEPLFVRFINLSPECYQQNFPWVSAQITRAAF